MEIVYEARCRYCGDVWELDLGQENYTDEEFLEITRQHSMYVVCENCARKYNG